MSRKISVLLLKEAKPGFPERKSELSTTRSARGNVRDLVLTTMKLTLALLRSKYWFLKLLNGAGMLDVA